MTRYVQSGYWVSGYAVGDGGVVGLVADGPSPLGAPEVLVSTLEPIAALVAVPSPLGSPAAIARHVVTVAAAVPSMLGSPAAVVRVVRYELKGEVRDLGVLVNRRVRAYRLSDGEMVGEADTVAGRFRIHAGFAAALHYVIPLDMAESATDYAPPTANRVLSVLAVD